MVSTSNKYIHFSHLFIYNQQLLILRSTFEGKYLLGYFEQIPLTHILILDTHRGLANISRKKFIYSENSENYFTEGSVWNVQVVFFLLNCFIKSLSGLTIALVTLV